MGGSHVAAIVENAQRRLKAAVLTILFGAISFLIQSTAVLAQAPPPWGTWKSTAGEAYLIVTPPNTCALISVPRNYQIRGSCDWNASYGGGILTIYNVYQQNAPFPQNIVYVGNGRISIFGEIFFRQQ